MKKTIIVLFLLLFVTYVKAQNKSFSGILTVIEQNQDSQCLAKFLDDEVLLFIPDAPIIYSKKVVLDLFKYSWRENKNNTNNKYTPNLTKENKNITIEDGIYSYKDENGEEIEMPYSIVGIKISNQYFIKEIVYANSKKEIPKLPKPTGKYNVGQSIHYYEKSISRIRPLAFQIWYPTMVSSESKLPFQSKEVAVAISNFLGWPTFNNSFTRLMKSNSNKDVLIVPNKKFPIVIYNHGYGGATTVYQSVFEELASHGYLVVSVGHQDESAFLLKEDGSVIQNSPHNDFYTKRELEINARAIGIEQSTILNSDNLENLTKAYKSLVSLSPLHSESVNLWVQDTENIIYLLEELNNQNVYLKGGFDFEKMGVFGHSVGGATAGEFGSKKIFKAGINIDGFQFGNLIHSNLKIPFMFISSNEEGNRLLRVSPFAKASKKPTYHAIIEGFSHGSFSDLQLFSAQGFKGIQLQRELILDFFNKYLKNENINLQDLSNRFVNLTITKF